MKYYKVNWLCNSEFGPITIYEVGLYFIDETHTFFSLLKRCKKYNTKYNYFVNEFIKAICNCEFVEISETEYSSCVKLFEKPFYFKGSYDRGLSYLPKSFDIICTEINGQIDQIKQKIKRSKQLIKYIYRECEKGLYNPIDPIYFSPYEENLLAKHGLYVKNELFGCYKKQTISLVTKSDTYN